MIFDIVIVMIQYYISSYITLHSITLHSIWCTVYLALYNITLSYDDDIVYCSNFWIPPISTSESLIFMESSSKWIISTLQQERIPAAMAPLAPVLRTPCDSLRSPSGWLFDRLEIWERSEKLGSRNAEGTISTQDPQWCTLKWQAAYLPLCLNHIFSDSRALPNSFESQAQTPL